MDNVVTIKFLWVHKSHQSKGCADILISNMISDNRNCVFVVNDDDNKEFLEKYGFSFFGQIGKRKC